MPKSRDVRRVSYHRLSAKENREGRAVSVRVLRPGALSNECQCVGTGYSKLVRRSVRPLGPLRRRGRNLAFFRVWHMGSAEHAT
jgi:hypothetical protein